MTYKSKNLSYDEVFDEAFVDAEACLYNIIWDEVRYELLIKSDMKRKEAVVFGTGAVAKGTPLPIFSRSTWMNDFPCTCIFYADPTFYDTDEATLLWHYGNRETWYLERISFLVYLVLKKLGIHIQNTCFFGSSGGGYSSIVIATLLRGKATVINPQCDISTFSKAHYDNFLRAVADGDEGNVAEERKRVVSLFERENFVPYLHYIQNIDAVADLGSQVIPFIRSFSEELTGISNHICVEFYQADGGHNAMPTKEETVEYIMEDLRRPVMTEGIEKDKADVDTFYDRMYRGEFCGRHYLTELDAVRVEVKDEKVKKKKKSLQKGFKKK